MTEAIASINGEWVPYRQAGLPLHDMGIVHGAAVTEMVRTFHHQPFRLDDHLERLQQSLAIVGFGTEISLQDLKQEALAVLAHNANLVRPEQELGLILFVTAGWNLTYLGRYQQQRAGKPSIGIHTFELPYELWAELYLTGQRLIVSSVQALPDAVLSPTAKSRSRLHWIVSNKQVQQTDPHAIAILADARGCLTETAAGNFFIVRDRELITPVDQILKGISRQTVIELSGEMNLVVREEAITAADVLAADEAFTTSTPYCILPVTQFQQQQIGDGKPGPFTQKLLAAWSNLVKTNIAEQMQFVRAEKNPLG